MAKILTDRTSVRVTAKSETDANNQKKNDANNIAKALGKDGDLDDTKASSVASKLGNTITDEDGTTWAKSSEVAAAAKELDGEIEETKTYRYGNVACISMTSMEAKIMPAYPNSPAYGPAYIDSDGRYHYIHERYDKNEGILVGFIRDTNSGRYYLLLSTSNSRTSLAYRAYKSPSDNPNSFVSGGAEASNSVAPFGAPASVPVTDVGQVFLSLSAYGDLHEETSGGSKVDTSKSEAQIKDEIESKAWAQGKAAKINPVEPNETYIAVTDANGNPLYFLGT